MIELSVSAYRGVNMGTVQLERVALVAGINGQGKTSFAQAAAAVLTGNFAAGLNLKKGEASLLINRGATQETIAKVSYPNGTALMRWPSCEYSTEGQPPRVSPFAAGILRFTSLKADDRSAALADYLQTQPTPDALRSALAVAVEAGPDDQAKWAAINGIIDLVAEHGYDAIEKRLREGSQKAKGAWQAITGVNYGTKVSQNWVPQGHDLFTLKRATPEAIQAEMDGLQKQYDEAIRNQAISETELSIIQQSADKLPQHEAAVVEAQKRVDTTAEALVAFAETRPAEPMKKGTPPLKCPHCEGEVEVTNFGKTLRPFLGGPTDEEIAAQEAVMKTWKDEHTRLTADHNDAKDKLATAKDYVNRSTSDKARAAELAEKSGNKGGDPAPIQFQIDQRRQLLKAISDVEAATKYAASILLNVAAADVLASDGLRKQTLSKALDNINSMLADMAKVAKWKPVSITDDMTIRYGNFAYEMCAESEKFRVNVLMQLAMAGIDGSPVVVIDAADILDADGKTGLFGLFNADTNRHFLVCMTVSKKEKVANIRKFGLGQSYWIEAGQVTELGG